MNSQNLVQRRKEEAFTIVELIFLMALVAIICIFINTRRGPDDRTRCASNIRCFGLALKQYALDNHDTYPTGATSSAIFTSLTNGGYLSLGSIFVCPSSTNIVWISGPFNAAHNSYSCVTGSADGSVTLLDTASPDTPLIFDTGLEGVSNEYPLSSANGKKWMPASNHEGDGGNVFCIGGSVAWKTKFDLIADGTNGFIMNP